MFEIMRKEYLVENIVMMDIKAPVLAKKAMPGQFLIVKVNEVGERIPLTVCDYDRKFETITIVFQIVGKSTEDMAALEVGDHFQDVVGPLGQMSEFIHEDIEELKKQNIVFIAGGVGTAPVYPQVKWLAEHGVEVDVIIGARNSDYVILEKEFRALTPNVYICTDDGSQGLHGKVTDMLQQLVDEGKKYDHAIAIGPMIMMKAVTDVTRPKSIKTVVSLNSVMVDGTGMCGACRVSVGGKTKFVCIDGPEFDAHQVDFDEMLLRLNGYKEIERKALEDYTANLKN
jgi:NAD(P)H-flavin reductase